MNGKLFPARKEEKNTSTGSGAGCTEYRTGAGSTQRGREGHIWEYSRNKYRKKHKNNRQRGAAIVEAIVAFVGFLFVILSISIGEEDVGYDTQKGTIEK